MLKLILREGANMCIIKLVSPNEMMENDAIDFKQEFFNNAETSINGDFKWGGMDNYAEWLKMIRDSLQIEACNPKWGVISTFFAVRESDNRIVGIINLSHTLTEKFINSGHIGYSVRPTERKRGYATEMLKLLLVYAKKQGLHDVELVCKNDNIGSIKTITANGGKLIRTSDDGKSTYLIALS